MASTITLTGSTIIASLAYEDSGIRAIVKGGGFAWDAAAKRWTRTFDSTDAAGRWVANAIEAGGSSRNRTNKHYFAFRLALAPELVAVAAIAQPYTFMSSTAMCKGAPLGFLTYTDAPAIEAEIARLTAPPVEEVVGSVDALEGMTPEEVMCANGTCGGECVDATTDEDRVDGWLTLRCPVCAWQTTVEAPHAYALAH